MPITTTTDVATLTTEDIRAYLPQLRSFLREEGNTEDAIDRLAPGILDAPYSYPSTLTRFRTWLIEAQRETEPLSTDRRALGEALAAMRRRERDAKADAHQAHRDLVQARQDLIVARDNLRRSQEEAQISQTIAQQPFNSEHPGWREFWLEAARNATRSGHCPEYDRHAELMGGITRDQFRSEGESLHQRENVTYAVTVSFTYTEVVENGEDGELTNYDGQSLAQLAYSHRYDLSDYTVEEVEREEYEG